MRSIRPADLARLRKRPRRGSSPPRSGCRWRVGRPPRSSSAAIGCGSRRRGSSNRRPSRSRATRPRGSAPARSWSISARGSAATRSRWPRTSRVLAVDLDPGMCRRILWNATVYDVGDRILAVRARAETFAIPAGAWVHLDPDRRAGRRPSGPRDRGLRARPVVRGSRSSGACPAGRSSSARPPTSRDISPGPGFEIELISLRGECKEATVWFGELASCRRRATRLPEGVTWTDRDAGAPGLRRGLPALVVDLRSRPVADPRRAARRIRPGARAEPGRRGGRLPDRGRSGIDTPFLAAFAVRDVSSMDLKHLRRMIERHRVGTLEIKVRGVGRLAGGAPRPAEAPRRRVGDAADRRRGGTARAVLARRE